MRIPILLSIAIAAIAIAARGALGESGNFNITEELATNPKYSDFNTVLSKSGLADTINAMNSLTVCVLTNSQMATLRSTLSHADSSDPKKVAALVRPMILLTFIDPTNPNTARSIRGSQQVASLYQAAGAASTDQGIANLTTTRKGSLQIVAAGGSNATITKSVKLIAYNLSIVEVSNPLLPTGVLGSDQNAPVVSVVPSPPPVKAPAKSPPSAAEDSSSTPDESDDQPDKTPIKSAAARASRLGLVAWPLLLLLAARKL
ncbi:fasciclin-like arabinogalactan protein 8 [Selaginella moellendorffii]|uniref:fasciclin-like arabinogalactan protein 8 n=1 Tax=Selaginella moellendorffii TaxID=88036 RepID=UPI000D1CEBC0|nr:fasciclin-like arabinogalactan protein 8 [Selaginella moellendorffii]|eukprot:XP_024515829.1 fasciclin-like arabinogalactan protein 8 [Selaginella moellendorffii]